MAEIVRRPVSNGDPLRVRARGLGKTYRLYGSVWARLVDHLTGGRRGSASEVETLCDVDLELHAGECVGVMGPNGAGKTTLLRILTGALFPTAGELEVAGRVTLLDLGGGLQPELSGRENLLRSAAAIGLNPRETPFEEMIEFSELGSAIEAPVKTYSSGMAMRLAFSLYAHIRPDVLIIDEAFAVGDARFVLKCTDKIRSLMEEGIAIVLASHDTSAVIEICERALVLDRGRVCFRGDPVLAADAYHTVLGIASGRQRASSQVQERALASDESRSVATFLATAVQREEAPAEDRDAAILGLSVARNGDGGTRVFSYGDECRVEWLVRMQRPSDCLTSGLHIHTPLGTYVFGTSYVHLGMPIAIPAPGHYLLSIRFPMRLAPGKYVLSLGIAEPDLERHAIGGAQLDRFRNAYEFEVLDFDLEPNEALPFLGLVDLQAEASPPRALEQDP